MQGFKIMKKRVLGPKVKLMEVYAPHVAKKAKSGQFIMLRVCEGGERIPLTIADFDIKTGNVTIIFQEVGKTTTLLGELEEGDFIKDFVGPLGIASELEGYKKVAVIGGGLGTAIAYPQVKALHKMGAFVYAICGFRNKDLIILEKEVSENSSKVDIVTDDGSNGNKGFVTDALKKAIENGNHFDLVVCIGPLPMMKAVADLTRAYGIKTIASMNSIMIDGTGMCGCCRLIVAGEVKFACVDGPDFDAHEIDFEDSMRRSRMYRNEEAQSLKLHECRLGGANNA